MIVTLNGRRLHEACADLRLALRALREATPVFTRTAKQRRIERERTRAKIQGTRELRAALRDAVDAMKRDVLNSAGLREAADGMEAFAFDARHIADAFAPTTETMYRVGMASARAELEARRKREAATTARLTTGFDVVPQAAIDALYQRQLQFAKDVTEREKAALKYLLLQALEEGQTGDELADAIREHFADGMHYVDDSGAIVKTVPDDSWIEMVARTEVARANNAGIMDTYKAAGVERVMWMAASDCCDECGVLDGQVFAIDEVPESHVNCRCTTIAADDAGDTVGDEEAA